MTEETQDKDAAEESSAPQQAGAPKQGGGGSSHGKVALGVAALAAATGAGAAAIAKQRSGGGQGSPNGKQENGSGRGEQIVSAAVGASRSAMFDAVIPAAEQAAEAAGRFLAKSGPDVLRERIVPKFVSGFTENADAES